MNLSHETCLTVPSIQWLGVRPSDFLGADRDKTGLLSLSARDRRVGRKMLDKKMNGAAEEWRRDLQMMLMLNLKAEIQILGGGEELGAWLDGKISGTLLVDEEEVMILD
jgi:meiotic recombination protein SPO11